MPAAKVLELGVLILALLAVAAALYCMTIEAIEAYENRDRSRKRSVEAEWRIQQIGSDARAQMWEATRRRDDGGG